MPALAGIFSGQVLRYADLTNTEHNENNRRRQVAPMPRYAETLGLSRASQVNDWQLFRVGLEFAQRIEGHHLTTFNFGCVGVSNKSIVCLNRSFLTNAAYARSVVFTDECPSKC